MKIWNSLNAAEKNKIRSFILQYFINNKLSLSTLNENEDLKNIVDENTVKPLLEYSEEPRIPQLLQTNDWDFYEINVTSKYSLSFFEG